MRWFRLHADAISNPKLKLLAFEDRWHFVAILCLKSEGLLDEERDPGLRERLIAAQLGLTVQDAAEVRRRLQEVDLVGDNWQPKGWSKYQYASDNSTDRVRKFRQKKQQSNGAKRKGNVSATPPDTDTDTDTEKKKKRARTRAAFKKPTVDDVRAYCEERGNRVDPERFVDFYTTKGWKVGRNPMQDWRAAVRTWERREDEKPDAGARPPLRIDDQLAHLRRIAGEEEGGAGMDPPGGNVRGAVYPGLFRRAE
jgi:hypothetical protein